MSRLKIWDALAAQWKYVDGVGGSAIPIATSISALNAVYNGTPSNGAPGILRLGASSPYDYVRLIYDSTTSKWYSIPSFAFSMGGPFGAGNQSSGYRQTAGSFTYSDNNNALSNHVTIGWRPYDTAGLKPNLKMVGFLGADTSGVVSLVRIAYRGCDTGGAQSAVSELAASEKSITAPASLALLPFDTGWVEISGVTVYDYIIPLSAIKGNGTNLTMLGAASIQLRWAS